MINENIEFLIVICLHSLQVHFKVIFPYNKIFRSDNSAQANGVISWNLFFEELSLSKFEYSEVCQMYAVMTAPSDAGFL